MKNASSQLIARSIAIAAIVLVFLLNTLSLAEGTISQELIDKADKLNINVENKITMPTVANVSEANSRYKLRVEGTDKWNDLIYKVSKQEDIDPIFVKCIMALESAGDANLVHYNTNNTYDSGLMQVNSSWTDFDKARLVSDEEYAIRCGIQVIKAKIQAAERNGKIPTAHEVAWRYNGYCEAGKRYANNFSSLYDDLNENKDEESIVLSEREMNRIVKNV